MNKEKLAAEQRRRNAIIIKEDDTKSLGECESCGFDTVLVADLGLCGPCCFGEADTLNGNW